MHPHTWTEEEIRGPGFWAATQGPACNDGALGKQAAAAFVAIGADPTWRQALGQQAAGQAARRRVRALLQDSGPGDAFESVDRLVEGAAGVLAAAGDGPAQEEVPGGKQEAAQQHRDKVAQQHKQGGDPNVGTSMSDQEVEAWYYDALEPGPEEEIDFDNGNLELLYQDTFEQVC